jgi:hypothetical protein
MPTFFMYSRHAPENCPVVHKKTRKAYLDWYNSIDKWTKKYNIKLLWGGAVPSEHLSIMIFEAPTLEAFQKASIDPAVIALMATETMKVKLAMGMEEGMKMMMK